MKKIYWAIPVVVFALGILVLSNSSTPLTTVNGLSGGINYRGYVCVYKNNQLVECKHNILVTTGKQWIQDKLAGTSAGTATVIAIGNGTTAQDVSDTDLPGTRQTGCNLAWQTGTYGATGTAGAWNVTHEWTSACDNMGINETGLYNGTSSQILFAETTFSTVTLMTNDKLNVTWGLQVS